MSLLRSQARQIEARLRVAELGLLSIQPPATGRRPPDDPVAHLAETRALLMEHCGGDPPAGLDTRIRDLGQAFATGEVERYATTHGVGGVVRFDTSGGHRIYRFRAETLPRHINNLHLVLGNGQRLLHDAGSAFPSSEQDIRLAFSIIADVWGEDTPLESVRDILISHAHVDHFSGGAWLAEETDARISVHELDMRVLVDFRERIVFAQEALRVFLRRSGMDEADQSELLDLYARTKEIVRSFRVDRVLRDRDRIAPGMMVYHVPGHCPGQVCLRVDDHLMTADHVLPDITPHLGPESITPHTGLTHYLDSLAMISRVRGIRRALPGHGDPIDDLRTRIKETRAHHMRRLKKLIDLVAEPQSTDEVCRGLFGPQSNYNRILAIEEAGAHLEHLHMAGRVRIANIDDVERGQDPTYRYQVR